MGASTLYILVHVLVLSHEYGHLLYILLCDACTPLFTCISYVLPALYSYEYVLGICLVEWCDGYSMYVLVLIRVPMYLGLGYVVYVRLGYRESSSISCHICTTKS